MTSQNNTPSPSRWTKAVAELWFDTIVDITNPRKNWRTKTVMTENEGELWLARLKSRTRFYCLSVPLSGQPVGYGAISDLNAWQIGHIVLASLQSRHTDTFFAKDGKVRFIRHDDAAIFVSNVDPFRIQHIMIDENVRKIGFASLQDNRVIIQFFELSPARFSLECDMYQQEQKEVAEMAYRIMRDIPFG